VVGMHSTLVLGAPGESLFFKIDPDYRRAFSNVCIDVF
jgi:hypothetical protein